MRLVSLVLVLTLFTGLSSFAKRQKKESKEEAITKLEDNSKGKDTANLEAQAKAVAAQRAARWAASQKQAQAKAAAQKALESNPEMIALNKELANEEAKLAKLKEDLDLNFIKPTEKLAAEKEKINSEVVTENLLLEQMKQMKLSVNEMRSKKLAERKLAFESRIAKQEAKIKEVQGKQKLVSERVLAVK